MTSILLKEFKNIIAGDKVFAVRAAISPLFMVVTWQQGDNELDVFSVAKGRDSWTALNENRYVGIAKATLKKYFDGKTSIKELENEYFNWEKETEKLYQEVMSLDLGSLSNNILEQYIYKVNDLYLGLAEYTIYIENLDYEIVASVIGEENKKYLDSIWERSTESAFMSFEGRRLKKIIDILTSSELNKARIAKYIYTDYFWIKTDEEVNVLLNEVGRDFAKKKKEYELLEETVSQKKKSHDDWLVGLDPIARKIAEYAQLVMHMRDVRKDPLAQVMTLAAELARVVMIRSEIDEKFAPFVLLYEYMKGVEYILSIKNNIEERVNGCVYLVHPDLSFKTENCNFESVIGELDSLILEKSEKSETLKGQIACKGKVTGIVRVIFDPHDDKGFQQGDILVTSMTRPEFVPIMKKAGAVVTNEGGITCHAAIVSRELNIPCIIGTKIATQVLKDGDMVEVDADNGVVRIVKY